MQNGSFQQITENTFLRTVRFLLGIKIHMQKGAFRGAYRKAVVHQYQKGRENLVPFAHDLACKV